MSGTGAIWIVLILILNFGVSWWNARTCGRAWEESKAVGGWIRVLVWCGAVQSAIGFSSVFMFPLIFLARAVFPETFTDEYVQATVNLWYVTIIFPALGTGLIITIESWIVAYRERSLKNLGVAAYNTFAQAHNTMSAINDFMPALRSVGEMFGKAMSGRGSSKGKANLLALMIVIAIVALAICGGALLTSVLIHRYAGTVPLPAGPVGVAGDSALQKQPA